MIVGYVLVTSTRVIGEFSTEYAFIEILRWFLAPFQKNPAEVGLVAVTMPSYFYSSQLVLF